MKMNEDNSTLDLFTRPAPYQAHSAPSIAAAEAIEPTAGTLRALVLQFIRTMGSHGATDEEIQQGCEIDPSTQRPRRIELWRAGLVQDSGKTRPTRSGRKATVWVCAS